MLLLIRNPAPPVWQSTMGAPQLLAHARAGLAQQRGVALTTITDDDLVAHFRAAIRPGGHYFEYLNAGQLAVCLGPTLFVHGAVTAKSIGFVPSPDTRFRFRGCPPVVLFLLFFY